MVDLMLGDWTRQELLQAAGIAGSLTTAVLSIVAVKMVRTIHVMWNSRMTQFLEGARAEGGLKERADADARALAKESHAEDRADDLAQITKE
jgi:hypothetical protein